jgi:hypothetical protein
MKTLKEFKAAFVPGAEMEVLNHVRAFATGRRVVTRVQTNGYYWKALKGPAVEKFGDKEAWTDFPKGSDLHFEVDGSVKVFGKHAPGLTTEPGGDQAYCTYFFDRKEG